MRPAHHKRHAEVLKMAKRCLKLRLRGWGYQRIADHVGISMQRAHQHVTEQLKAIPREDADRLRELEIDRLDQILAGGVRDRALAGDPKAVQAVIQIATQRARLLGLYAPTKIAGHDGGPLQINASTLPDDELRAIVQGDKVHGPGQGGSNSGAPPSGD